MPQRASLVHLDSEDFITTAMQQTSSTELSAGEQHSSRRQPRSTGPDTSSAGPAAGTLRPPLEAVAPGDVTLSISFGETDTRLHAHMPSSSAPSVKLRRTTPPPSLASCRQLVGQGRSAAGAATRAHYCPRHSRKAAGGRAAVATRECPSGCAMRPYERDRSGQELPQLSRLLTGGHAPATLSAMPLTPRPAPCWPACCRHRWLQLALVTLTSWTSTSPDTCRRPSTPCPRAPQSFASCGTGKQPRRGGVSSALPACRTASARARAWPCSSCTRSQPTSSTAGSAPHTRASPCCCTLHACSRSTEASADARQPSACVLWWSDCRVPAELLSEVIRVGSRRRLQHARHQYLRSSSPTLKQAVQVGGSKRLSAAAVNEIQALPERGRHQP